MKWVKHMTASHDDEKLADLITRYGHAGYGVWWLVVEIVAARVESGDKAEVTYPVSKWSHLLSVRGSHVRQCLLKLEVTHLVTLEWNDTDITVRIPNVLKYRDEYSRKSGQTPDKLRSKNRTELEADKEQDKEPPKPPAPVGAEIPVRKVHKAIKEALAISPEEEMVQETAKRLCETHPGPNGCGQAEAAKQIRGILKKLPRPEWAQKLLSIEQNHAAWCLTEKWAGGYASGLANWLAPTVFRYDTKPTSNGNGHANPKVFVDDGLFEKLSSPDEPPLSPVAARYKQS